MASTPYRPNLEQIKAERMYNALDHLLAEAIEPIDMSADPEAHTANVRPLAMVWAQLPSASEAMTIAAADIRRLADWGATVWPGQNFSRAVRSYPGSQPVPFASPVARAPLTTRSLREAKRGSSIAPAPRQTPPCASECQGRCGISAACSASVVGANTGIPRHRR
jgi:hypothetical protein